MTINRSQIDALQAVTRYTQRNARNIITATLGNNSGTVEIANRAGWVWVRLHGDANQVVAALAVVSFPKQSGVTVDVELVKRKAASFYQVLGIAASIVYAENPYAGTVGTHATQHLRSDYGLGGIDPLDVYPRMIAPLRARAQSAPDLTVYVEPGDAIINGVRVEWSGGNSPTFAPPTAANQRRFDLIYLDANGDLQIATGDEITSLTALPTRPALVTNSFPVCCVLLQTGQTEIIERNIADARTPSGAHVHAQQTANHRLESWVYADATARAAATGFVTGDVGRVAYQSDTGSYWRLTDDDPVAWEQVGGSGGGTPSDTVETETAYGQESDAGEATDYSRGDHTHGTPAVPAHGDLSSIGADDHHTKAHTHNNVDGSGQLQLAVDVARYGFVDNAQTSIGFDGTNTFTLTDAGTGWDYYRAGVRYHITGNKTVTLSGSPPATAGAYFVYIDATDGTLTVSTSAWTLLDTKVPVAMISWNNSLTPKYWLMDERHTCLIDRRMHYYEHVTEGTKYVGGGIPSGYAVAPSSPADADNRFGISETYISDEDLNHVLAALSDPSGSSAYVLFYRTAAATWAWQSKTMPYYYTTSGYVNWDNAGTMTEGTPNYYINTYLIYTNLSSDARYIMVNGRAQFANLALAQAENPGTFAWTGINISEFVIAYQLTWELKNSHSTNGKCRLAAEPRRLNISLTQTSVAQPSLDHNGLGGLQGGQAAQYYHIDAAQHASIVGAQIAAYLFLR